MPLPACDDNAFIAVWQSSRSTAEVADRLGVQVREVFRRRRRIEDRYGFRLQPIGGEPSRHWHPQTEHYILDHQYTAVIFSDAHFWPERLAAPSPALWVLLQVLQDLQPDVVIDNGDSFDGASISRHPPHGWTEQPTVDEEIEANKLYHGLVQEAAGEADRFWIWGNHDARFDSRLAATAAEFRGVDGMTLPNHFTAWTFAESVCLNETLLVKHKWHGGQLSGRNNALRAGKSIATGHLHIGKIDHVTDLNGLRYGINLPTLADPHGPQFAYANHNPLDWQQGFAVVEVDGATIHPELVIVEGGKARWRGKTYNG